MADGSIVLVEIQGKTLTRVTPDRQQTVIADLGGGPNGAAIGPDGAVYITNNGGSFAYHEVNGLNIPGATPPDHKGGLIQRVDLKTGAVTTLDKQGGMWFTDHGSTTPTGRNYGGLYYAKADGSKVTRWREGMISPNGVGLSPDEKTVYVADTHLGRLWAFDVTEPGALAEAPPLQPGRVVHNLPGYQLLDSLAVEAGGKVCVATIINGGITAFDEDGTTEHFPFPDILCTNIVFGGADMQDAWVTASGTGKLYKCRWPRPGLKLNFNA